jgi:hypothetical protein
VFLLYLELLPDAVGNQEGQHIQPIRNKEKLKTDYDRPENLETGRWKL